MKVLNAYAGVGGNRKLWENCQVVAVEIDEKIASVYKKLNPNDEVVVGDAHDYIRENHEDFDFIWTSPPCQTHSRMAKFTRHKNKKYPCMKLYEEIIFLDNFFSGKYVVENVKPYYEPLIKPSSTVGRHVFWSNFAFHVDEIRQPDNFINLSNIEGKRKLQDWLGIHYEEKLYYSGNHCPAQVLRNCVHPEVGLSIFNQSKLV